MGCKQYSHYFYFRQILMFWIRTFFYYYNGLSSINIVGNEHFSIIIFLIILISFSWYIYIYIYIFFFIIWETSLHEFQQWQHHHCYYYFFINITVIIINAIINPDYIFSIIIFKKKTPITEKITKWLLFFVFG